MNLLEVLVKVLAALTYGIVWLLAACAWILLPISHSVRYPGLVAIGVAMWLQHRPRGNRDPRA